MNYHNQFKKNNFKKYKNKFFKITIIKPNNQNNLLIIKIMIKIKVLKYHLIRNFKLKTY